MIAALLLGKHCKIRFCNVLHYAGAESAAMGSAVFMQALIAQDCAMRMWFEVHMLPDNRVAVIAQYLTIPKSVNKVLPQKL